MLPLLAMMLVLLTFQARDAAVRLDRHALRQVIAVGLLIPLFSLALVPVFFRFCPVPGSLSGVFSSRLVGAAALLVLPIRWLRV